MSTMDLSKQSNVFVLTLTNGDAANTFTDEVLAEFNQHFDEIEASKDNAALIITSNHEKFWSTGINLKWLEKKPEGYIHTFAATLDAFLKRIALLNIPTVANITGHAYGGGALMAAAMDFRMMNTDIGNFCYPEINVNIPFTPTMHALIKHLVPAKTYRAMAFTGVAFDAKQAFEYGVIDDIASQDKLWEKSFGFAEMLAGKDRKTYALIKKGMRNYF